MNRKHLLVNIFSNWTNLALMIVISFYVSPILVHRLGNEQYGVWTIIVSITGYFTLLDFGLNNAIVRFISKYVAQKESDKANEVYNTSLLFFGWIAFAVLVLTLVGGWLFTRWHTLAGTSASYLYLVFALAGLDVAGHLLCGVFSATLTGLQEFFKMNVASIVLTIFKNIVLVMLVFSGHKLLTVAVIQLAFNLLRHLWHYLIIKKQYAFFHVDTALWTAETFRTIVSYSVYSFIIAIAGRVIYLTDSIVIGAVVNVGAVTFYAIPASLLDYLGRVVGAITGVLVPVISSQEAVGEMEKNRTIYLTVTKYLLLLMLPIIFVLFTVGHDFITLWMGPEYGAQGKWTLRILLIGYSFSFCQWIAYSILLGTSRHVFSAYVMVVEAVANLGISIVLGRIWGIEGVALGTTIPLLLANVVVIPIYVCRLLEIKTRVYYARSFFWPVLLLGANSGLYALYPIHIVTYLELLVYSAGVAAFWWGCGLFLIIEREHREWVLARIRERLHFS